MWTALEPSEASKCLVPPTNLGLVSQEDFVNSLGTPRLRLFAARVCSAKHHTSGPSEGEQECKHRKRRRWCVNEDCSHLVSNVSSFTIHQKSLFRKNVLGCRPLEHEFQLHIQPNRWHLIDSPLPSEVGSIIGSTLFVTHSCNYMEVTIELGEA
jgi:hypothetical protein